MAQNVRKIGQVKGQRLKPGEWAATKAPSKHRGDIATTKDLHGEVSLFYRSAVGNMLEIL